MHTGHIDSGKGMVYSNCTNTVDTVKRKGAVNLRTLDFRDSRPLYEQIITQIQQQISSGILQEGDQLPSVREMASHLSINPNTIQRAYRELESGGWIVSVPGKGSFVCENKNSDGSRKKELLDVFDETAMTLMDMGVSPMELVARLTQLGGRNHA